MVDLVVGFGEFLRQLIDLLLRFHERFGVCRDERLSG